MLESRRFKGSCLWVFNITFSYNEFPIRVNELGKVDLEIEIGDGMCGGGGGTVAVCCCGGYGVGSDALEVHLRWYLHLC